MRGWVGNMGVRVVDGRVERGMRRWETWVRGLWVEGVMRDVRGG